MNRSSRTRRFAEDICRALETHFAWKSTAFLAPESMYPCCHEKRMTVQHHQMLRLAQKARLQRHQILRLPRKFTLMIYARHLWNVIFNEPSNRHHPPTSPNAAPARKIAGQYLRESYRKQLKRPLHWRTIRAWSEHDRNMNSSSRARSPRLLFALRRRIFQEKWHSNITKCRACHGK